MTLDLSRPDLQRTQNFINARWCDAAQGRRFAVSDPASDEVFAQVPDSGASDARAAVDAAHAALPAWRATPAKQRAQLLKDRYIVLLRKGHPFAKRRRSGQALLEALQELDYVAVRTHADTLRILQLLNLEDRVRLTTEHFMVLPAIVRATDLAVVMPRNIARGFAEEGGYAIVEPSFPLRDFTVSLHWSKRFEADPANHWLRQVITSLFSERRTGCP